MKKHKLKLLKKYYELNLKGLKNWEIRRNDRDFEVNDVLEMTVIDDKTFEPVGVIVHFVVKNVFQEKGFGLEDGYCILSLSGFRDKDYEALEGRILELRDELKQARELYNICQKDLANVYFDNLELKKRLEKYEKV